MTARPSGKIAAAERVQLGRSLVLVTVLAFPNKLRNGLPARCDHLGGRLSPLSVHKLFEAIISWFRPLFKVSYQ